ncbi:MAG: phospholipid carrier-dependent glycosyltransferase [Zestosphaera sp.]
MSLRVFDFMLLALMLALSLFYVLVFQHFTGSVLPPYRDESIYIECGLEYVVDFTPPIECNFEHPPLGKYLIGFVVLFGFGRVFYLLFLMFGSSLLVYFLVKNLFASELLGFFAGFLLVLDTVFINSHRFLLLDPLAVFFFLLSLYFVLSRSSLIASGVFFGLGVACKFSVAPYFLVFMYVFVKRWGFVSRRFIKGLFVFVCVAFVSYLLTYVADLMLGPYAIIQHHIDMFSYMSWRHGFSLPIAVNGLMKLISKVEVWRYGGDFTLTFSTVDSTQVLINSTFVPGSGSFVYLGLGLGSVFWYVMLPSLLINTYYVLARESGFSESLVCLAGWVSLTTILPGPLDWYYVNALPLLYANVALLVKHLMRSREYFLKHLVLSSVVVQFLVTSLTLAGFIPYRIEVFLPR